MSITNFYTICYQICLSVRPSVEGSFAYKKVNVMRYLETSSNVFNEANISDGCMIEDFMKKVFCFKSN